MFNLSVVVPAYNESARIGASIVNIMTYLRSQPISYEVIVVDDGSDDDTLAVLRQLAKDWRRLQVVNIPHGGKGAAVRAGMLLARGELRLLCDADLSTPIAEVRRLREELISARADIAIASRALPQSRVLVPAPKRRVLMGKAYNRLVRALLLPDLRDTQCGFKLFTDSAAVLCFAGLSCQGFGFDVEALSVAHRHGLGIVEVPSVWRDVSGSHVSSVRDSLVMLLGLFRVRWNLYGLRSIRLRRHAAWQSP